MRAGRQEFTDLHLDFFGEDLDRWQSQYFAPLFCQHSVQGQSGLRMFGPVPLGQTFLREIVCIARDKLATPVVVNEAYMRRTRINAPITRLAMGHDSGAPWSTPDLLLIQADMPVGKRTADTVPV